MLSAVFAVVVCLSVCVSVCLSHSGIVSKRLKPGTHYPYVRPVYTGAFFAPVYTGRIYGWCVPDTRIYDPYIRPVQKKLLNPAFLPGIWSPARPVYTGVRYTPPVYTARIYGPYIRVVCTGLKRRITQTTPHDSPMILVFWCQRSWRNSNGITPYGGDNAGGVG